MFTKIALSRECDLMGLMQQSLDYARQAVAADSSKANSLWYLADTYLDAGMTDSALTTINQYIELVPDDYSGYYTRGMIAVRRGQYDKALNDFDFAVVLDDSFVNAHLFRGIMLNSFGRTAEARKEFESTVPGRKLHDPLCQRKEGKAPSETLSDPFASMARAPKPAAPQTLDEFDTSEFYGDESYNEDELTDLENMDADDLQ